MKVLKNNNKLIFELSRILKNLTEELRNNTVVYDLLRCHMYCKESGNVCFDFIATTEEGTYRCPVVEIDPSSKVVYYDKWAKSFGYSQEAEAKIVNATINSLIQISKLCDNVGDIYWEVPFERYNHQKGYVAINPANGELVVFLIVSDTFSDNFVLSESAPVCGRTLSGNWYSVATEIEKGYTNYRDVVLA